MPEAPAASAGGQISDQNRNISKAPTGVVHHRCTRSYLRGHQQQQGTEATYGGTSSSNASAAPAQVATRRRSSVRHYMIAEDNKN